MLPSMDGILITVGSIPAPLIMTCKEYKAESNTCALDDIVCAETECPRGMYSDPDPDPEDQGNPWEGSKCTLVCFDEFTAFQCSIPDWM